jgi:hypothetical protein
MERRRSRVQIPAAAPLPNPKKISRERRVLFCGKVFFVSFKVYRRIRVFESKKRIFY